MNITLLKRIKERYPLLIEYVDTILEIANYEKEKFQRYCEKYTDNYKTMELQRKIEDRNFLQYENLAFSYCNSFLSKIRGTYDLSASLQYKRKAISSIEEHSSKYLQDYNSYDTRVKTESMPKKKKNFFGRTYYDNSEKELPLYLVMNKYIISNHFDLPSLLMRKNDISNLIHRSKDYGIAEKYLEIKGLTKQDKAGGTLKGIEIRTKIFKYTFSIFEDYSRIEMNIHPRLQLRERADQWRSYDLYRNNREQNLRKIELYFDAWLYKVRLFLNDFFSDVNISFNSNHRIASGIEKIETIEQSNILSEIIDELRVIKSMNSRIEEHVAASKVQDIIQVKPSFMGVEVNVNQLVKNVINWV